MKIFITAYESVLGLEDRVKHTSVDDYIGITSVDYLAYIKPALTRRMSTLIRMAVASAKITLQKANIEIPDAIVVGTGLGCLTDTKRFLSDLCKSEEGLISPTAFIQSTHNTVAGQIALLLNCTGYNSTYSDRSHSFEQALLDAKLLLMDGMENVLVGAADEYIDMVESVVNSISKTNHLNDLTNNYFLGAGSSFFALSKTKSSDSLQLKALKLLARISQTDLKKQVLEFLSFNKLRPRDIDAIVFGDWMGSNDSYYQLVTELFEKIPPLVYYKNQSGHYFTSSAYALHTACHILKTQCIPKSMTTSETTEIEVRNILIYHHYKASKHTLYLISN